jgi:predicted RNase H-like HicB family nuclease
VKQWIWNLNSYTFFAALPELSTANPTTKSMEQFEENMKKTGLASATSREDVMKIITMLPSLSTIEPTAGSIKNLEERMKLGLASAASQEKILPALPGLSASQINIAALPGLIASQDTILAAL